MHRQVGFYNKNEMFLRSQVYAIFQGVTRTSTEQLQTQHPGSLRTGSWLRSSLSRCTCQMGRNDREGAERNDGVTTCHQVFPPALNARLPPSHLSHEPMSGVFRHLASAANPLYPFTVCGLTHGKLPRKQQGKYPSRPPYGRSPQDKGTSLQKAQSIAVAWDASAC